MLIFDNNCNAGSGSTYGGEADGVDWVLVPWIGNKGISTFYKGSLQSRALTRHLWLVGGGDDVDLGERK